MRAFPRFAVWQFVTVAFVSAACNPTPATRGDSTAVVGASAPLSSADSAVRCGTELVSTVRWAVCRFSPASTQLHVFWKSSSGRAIGNFTALEQLLRADGKKLVLAMNGGMYGRDALHTPVGLYVENGRELVSLNVRDSCCGNFYDKPNGIFYIHEGRAGIMEAAEFATAGVKPGLATQSGPLLVRHGEFPHDHFSSGGPKAATRNAVGIEQGGRVVLVMAATPTSMHEFRAALRDHFHLTDALYLDGVVSRFYMGSGTLGNDDTFGAILAVVAPDE